MSSNSIAQSIQRSLERRRRLRTEGGGDAGAPPAAGDPIIAACSAELDRTIRSSILSSFTQWEVNLVPEIEGLARRVALRAAGAPGGAAPKLEPASSSPTKGAGAPASEPPKGLTFSERSGAPSGHAGAAETGSPGEDSWNVLAEAVRELRQEWDRESFESRFGADEIELPPTYGEAQAAAPPGVVAEAAAEAPGAPAAPAPPAEPGRRELAQKLDELIQLVKGSIDTREVARPAEVSKRMTREIAREVAGQLRDTIAAIRPTAAAAPAPAQDSTPQAAPPPPRIRFDDVTSIIDQITGSRPA